MSPAAQRTPSTTSTPTTPTRTGRATTRSPRLRTGRAVALAGALLALLGSTVGATQASATHESGGGAPGDDGAAHSAIAKATAAYAVAPGTGYGANPLAGGRWGVYTGSADGVFPAWQAATGENKDLLAKSALQPRVRWMGHWISSGDITGAMRDYITSTQGGDPEVLVPMAVFRLWPEGEMRRDKPLSLKQQREYRQWVDNAAAGIGGSRVAMVLEPDLALVAPAMRSEAMSTADPKVRTSLVRYAAKKFGSLPRTTVYLDSGDGDWLTVEKSVALLKAAGIKHVRGFALGATHYSSVSNNVTYGRDLVAALARAGVPGKHFVVDTADNGRPFTWLQYRAKHPGSDFDNAQVCGTTAERRCVTLGIPPTVDVAASRWGLSKSVRSAARQHVDGYLWFGRPWLFRQASPFVLDRTLAVGRTTPY